MLTSALMIVACAGGGGPQPTTTTTATTTTSTTTTTTTTTTTSSRASGQIAQASDGSFIVALPNGWQAKSAGGNPMNLQATGRDAGITVVLVKAEYRGRTVKESAELEQKRLVNQLKAVMDPGGIESTTVDGEPAERFTAIIPADNTPPASPEARTRFLMVRHHDVEYLVQFTVVPPADFNDAIPDFESVMDSWKWSN